MRPVTVTQTGVGASVPVRIDRRATDMSITVACSVTGTATYSVQWAPDNPPATWFNDNNVNGATANAYTTWAAPVAYFRLNVTAGTGTVTMIVLQGGP